MLRDSPPAATATAPVPDGDGTPSPGVPATAGGRRPGKYARLAAVRALWTVPVILGVVTLTFLLARVLAPDPTSLFVPPQADPATRAQVRERLGLGDPIPVQ